MLGDCRGGGDWSASMLASQAPLRGSLLLIRPGKCANYPADCADHARAEGGNRGRISENVHIIHHRFAVAQLACHGQRAHAVRAHVGKGHRWSAVAISGARRGTFRVPDRGSGNPTPLGGVGSRHYPCRLKGWKRTNGAAILFGTASTIWFG